VREVKKCRNAVAAMFKFEIISYNNIELLPTLMQFPIFHVQLFIFSFFFISIFFFRVKKFIYINAYKSVGAMSI